MQTIVKLKYIYYRIIVTIIYIYFNFIIVCIYMYTYWKACIANKIKGVQIKKEKKQHLGIQLTNFFVPVVYNLYDRKYSM